MNFQNYITFLAPSIAHIKSQDIFLLKDVTEVVNTSVCSDMKFNRKLDNISEFGLLGWNIIGSYISH